MLRASSAAEANSAGASGPTRRAKPGIGLGSSASRAVASRKLSRAVRRSPGSAWASQGEKRPAGEPAVDRVRPPVPFAALEDQRQLEPDVGVGPRPVERPQLPDGLLRGLVPLPVEPEHPLLVEGEDLALTTGTEQPVAAGAETGQQRILARMVVATSATGRRCWSAARAARARSSWVRASSRATCASSWWATTFTGPLGVSMCTSASRSRRCSGPCTIRTDWVLACGTMSRWWIIQPCSVTSARSSQP